MYSNREILYRFMLVLLPSVIKSTASFSTRTFVGKYFSEHEFDSVRVDDWMGCIVLCYDKPLCVSYNYHLEKNTCLLNDHGIEDVYGLDDQLLDYDGWVFQQLRPVTKTTTRFARKTSCPCNCGSSDQCYSEPGIGDVPDKAAGSCKEIIDRRGFVRDGGYYLKQNSHKVFCHMTPIPECDDTDGGWTLVMKINGNSTTFKYDADLWTNKQLYQQEHGGDLTERETKLNTFNSLTFQEMCLGMKTVNSTIHWVKRDGIRPGTQLLPIFGEAHWLDTLNYKRIPLHTWKQIQPEFEIDTVDPQEGFDKKSNDDGKVRIGILGFRDSGGPATSCIGFGIGGRPDGMQRISCGNVHNNQSIPTFGYILVR